MTLAPKWITPAGSIGTFPQGKTAQFTLTTIGARDFDIIAGDVNSVGYFSFAITTGTSYTDYTSVTITGSPFSVNNNITSEFVVRARNEYGSNDRTFTISITGPVDPLWDTPAGYLQVGPNLEPYCLNRNRVDFLLQATAIGLPQGQTLRYYISDNDGQLPPGLQLNQNTGLISGYVFDQLSLDFQASKTGGYDAEYYDMYPYDHVLVINNTNVDGRLVSITKVYTFYVTVTDGISSARRKFQIRVEDPNTFRTDTTQITDDTTNYLADIGYLIPPIWLGDDNSLLPNPSNLGTLRANNNQVINLNAYDPYPFVGPISFDWDIIKVNPEIRLLSNSETDITGAPTSNLSGQSYLVVSKAVGVPAVGMYLQLYTYVNKASQTVYRITSVEEYGTGYKLGIGINTKYKGEINTTNNFPLTNSPGDMYKVLANNHYYVCTGVPSTFIDVGANAPGYINYYLENTIQELTTLFIGSLCKHPPGLELNPDSGLLYGRLPYQPAYSQNYRFTVRITKTDQENGQSVSNNHIFNLTLKGDIETTIAFTSNSNLGSIQPGHISDLAVKAIHTAANLDITYSLTGGKLPPGLTLTPTGNITGMVPTNIQTDFDIATQGFNKTTFDIGSTTFDRTYTFNITARDSYLFSAISKDFTISIYENTITPYTNIYVKPLLKKDQRQYIRSLVEDFNIFNPKLLYRGDDPNFGVQREVKMTIEYGIQKIDLDKYVPALTDYFKRRRYFMGDLKTAVAVDSKGNHVYDVVYIDIIDNQMIGNKISVAKSFTQVVNGVTVTYYPDSVLNEQYALSTIQITQNQTISIDDQFRPKFMQTLQSDTGVPLGFVKAYVLCYTLPNESSKIVSSIKRSGFDFKLIDFDIDRIAIENTLDFVGTKYLVFGATSGDTGFYINTEDEEDLLTEDSNPILI